MIHWTLKQQLREREKPKQEFEFVETKELRFQPMQLRRSDGHGRGKRRKINGGELKLINW